MTKILFVDHDTELLEEMREIFASEAREWDMSFAVGGEAALTMLATTPFDVIVSEMRMPGIDGAALLHITCEKYPNILRIILSRATEVEASFRAVPVAHQFLLKPCAPQDLRAAIERATSLVEALNSKLLVSMVGSLRTLPSLPSTYMELRNVLSKPESSVDQVVSIVERDVAISAKVLQLVNSAFFGVRRQVNNIKTAVSFLGINILHHLILSVEAFRCFKIEKPIKGFSFEEFHRHSQATAQVAGAICVSPIPASAAVVAGLLHDIGKLVIAERAPDHLARAIAGAEIEGMPLYASEEQLCGVSHAEVGAYLLSLWGLPFPIVETVAHHHHPQRFQETKFEMKSLVYLSNILAHEHFDDALVKRDELLIDGSVLAIPGISERLDGWHQMAGKLAEEMEGARQH
jgi:putative nucleotidyltransferase with HDIG domain